MNKDIEAYSEAQQPEDRLICNELASVINACLKTAESKIWHAHPVWFINGNPIAGYSKPKHCVRLLFWSGQSFDEPELKPEGKFKAAEARYTSVGAINTRQSKKWLKKPKPYSGIIKTSSNGEAF